MWSDEYFVKWVPILSVEVCEVERWVAGCVMSENIWCAVVQARSMGFGERLARWSLQCSFGWWAWGRVGGRVGKWGGRMGFGAI